MIEIRPSTQADIVELSGHRARKTIRALTVLVDGRVACVAGITVEPDGAMAFSDTRAGLDVPRATIYRQARLLAAAIRGWGIPAVAIADPGRPNSGKFLERLGLDYVTTCEQGKVYSLWPKSPSPC